jgi:hypothetical protein
MNNDGSYGNIATGIGQIATGLAPIAGTGAQLYGQQNAAQAVETANNAAIKNQTDYLGNIGSIYNPYTSTGAHATDALGRALGLGGGAPDYSGFMNMPGYQFAIDQGTRALQRNATAQGNAYTPNESAAVGSYVAGTAMQDYNTYIGQLSATADRGAQAANQFGNITYSTGANTSQLMANTGQSQAGMYTGMGQTVGGALGGYTPGGFTPGYGGAGGYGAPGASGVGGLAGGIGNIVKGVGSLFSGGGGNPTDTSGSNYDPSTGQYSNGFTPGQFGGSDYSPYVSTGPAPEGWIDPNAGMDWLSQGGGATSDWSMVDNTGGG